jgi:hypothetical protein
MVHDLAVFIVYLFVDLCDLIYGNGSQLVHKFVLLNELREDRETLLNGSQMVYERFTLAQFYLYKTNNNGSQSVHCL